MANIKGKDTRPELSLRTALWAKGLRYRLDKSLPGRPDIVFVTPKVAVFVDGCFWHKCPMHSASPKNNREFWRQKLTNNVKRDRRVNAQLKQMGWSVVRVWEHQVASELDLVVKRIIGLNRKRGRERPEKRIYQCFD